MATDLKMQNLMVDFKKKAIINSDNERMIDDNDDYNEIVSDTVSQKIIDSKYCHGQYFTYWDNGSIATVINYCDNILHGRQTFRHSTMHGYKLGYQYRHVDGKQHGVQETWLSNGLMKDKWYMFYGTEISENEYFRYLNLTYAVIHNIVKDRKLIKLIGGLIVDFDN